MASCSQVMLKKGRANQKPPPKDAEANPIKLSIIKAFDALNRLDNKIALK